MTDDGALSPISNGRVPALPMFPWLRRSPPSRELPSPQHHLDERLAGQSPNFLSQPNQCLLGGFVPRVPEP